MAIAADLDCHFFFCRTNVKSVAASADNRRFFEVFWMYFRFHSGNTISEVFKLCKAQYKSPGVHYPGALAHSASLILLVSLRVDLTLSAMGPLVFLHQLNCVI